MERMNDKINKLVWDCIIIGGGFAGLTAATFLAKAGKSVLVLEKGRKLGGRAITSEKEGSQLNLGPHALYSKGKSIEILSELGIEVQGGTPVTNGRVIYGGQMEPLPVEPVKLLASSLFSWKGKLELIRFYMNLKKLSEDENSNLTLEQWLHHNMKDDNAKKFLLMLVRLSTYGNEPHLIRAKAAFQQLQIGDALYVHGGWQVLVDSLVEKARSFGVSFESGASVLEIKGKSPQFSVSVNGNKTYMGKNIISTASPDETNKILQEHEESPSLQFLKDFIPVKAACLDLVLNHLPERSNSFVLNMDRPLYYSNHSAVAKLSKDSNHSVIHILKYLNSSNESEAEDRIELEEFIDQIQPGWKKYVVYKRYLPQMAVSYFPKKGNLPPDVEHQPLPGFYLAGDWVGSEGMLADRSFISARKAAVSILEQETKSTII